MGHIAVFGWGSLVWDPRELPLRSRWRADGPCLPVEFARRSSDDRVTLVLAPGVPMVRTYWATSGREALDAAVADLAAREGCAAADIGRRTRSGARAGRDPGHPAVAAVDAWLTQRAHVEAAVWTALPWTFALPDPATPDARGDRRLVEQVLAHLRGLDGLVLRRAREYVEQAPPQTVTPVRTCLEQVLGWGRRPLPGDLFDGPASGPPCR